MPVTSRSFLRAGSEIAFGFVAVALILVCVWQAPEIYDRVYGSAAPAQSAGDKFTALTALFAALAFAALIYTSVLQRRELELQRMELTLTRKELERSAAAQESAQEALRQQAETSREAARITVSAMPILVPYVLHHAKSFIPKRTLKATFRSFSLCFRTLAKRPASSETRSPSFVS